MTKYEENKIWIGKHKDKKIYLDMDKNVNGHILVTGSTGTGKTNFLKNYLNQLEGQRIIILDYSSSFTDFKGADYINIEETEEVLNFFEDCTDETMGMMADAIQGAYRFGVAQRATIINALGKMMKPLKKENLSEDTDDNFFRKYLKFDDGIARKDWALFTFLLSTQCDSKGEQLAARMVEVVTRLNNKKIKCRNPEKNAGILSVTFPIQYSGLNAQLVELYLWKFWLKQIKEWTKVTLVLDECQDLNWKKGSISERLLSEGRKFGVGIILSTQFLTANFPQRVIAGFMQSGFRVIFSPTEMEVRDLAKSLDVNHWQVYAKKLRNLRVGSCFVSGVMYLDDRLSRQKLEICVPQYKESCANKDY